jgi:hypothetical protein
MLGRVCKAAWGVALVFRVGRTAEAVFTAAGRIALFLDGAEAQSDKKIYPSVRGAWRESSKMNEGALEALCGLISVTKPRGCYTVVASTTLPF